MKHTVCTCVVDVTWLIQAKTFNYDQVPVRKRKFFLITLILGNTLNKYG